MYSPTPEILASKAELARRRARRSRLLVRLAILLGCGLGVAFTAQSIWFKPVAPPPPEVPLAKTDVIAGGRSSFSGIDVNSKPFSVTAEKGVQDKTNASLMHLETVSGGFVRKAGGDVQVSSDNADYDVKTKDLSLRGNVRFEEPGRYVARFSSAQVNLERQRITANESVQVETAGATILADGMETSEDGSVIRLHGHVQASFNLVDAE